MNLQLPVMSWPWQIVEIGEELGNDDHSPNLTSLKVAKEQASVYEQSFWIKLECWTAKEYGEVHRVTAIIQDTHGVGRR